MGERKRERKRMVDVGGVGWTCMTTANITDVNDMRVNIGNR